MNVDKICDFPHHFFTKSPMCMSVKKHPPKLETLFLFVGKQGKGIFLNHVS